MPYLVVMGTEKQIDTNPIDTIRSGEVLEVPEGLLIFENQMVILDGGLLIIVENGTLKFKE